VWWRFDRWAKDGTWDRVLAAVQGDAHAAAEMEWLVSVDSTVARAHQHAAGRAPGRLQSTQGARSNYKNLPVPRPVWPEPLDHALGRSRGGWSTKTHLSVDRLGRPLSVRLTPGQAGDNPQLLPLLDEIAVPGRGAGPRSHVGVRRRPDCVIADKAYSHPSTRAALRRWGIRVVIPERRDQIAHRAAKGRAGDDHRASMPGSTATATLSNEPSTDSSNGAASPPATTNTPATTALGSSSPASSNSGYGDPSDRP